MLGSWLPRRSTCTKSKQSIIALDQINRFYTFRALSFVFLHRQHPNNRNGVDAHLTTEGKEDLTAPSNAYAGTALARPHSSSTNTAPSHPTCSVGFFLSFLLSAALYEEIHATPHNADRPQHVESRSANTALCTPLAPICERLRLPRRASYKHGDRFSRRDIN